MNDGSEGPERQVRDMNAVDTPQRTETVEQTDRRSPGLPAAVVVLAVIAAVLAGWLGYELLSTDETAVPAEVQTVIDDYAAAWNASDTQAFSELVTSDYRFYNSPVGRPDRTPPGQPGETVDEVAAMITDDLAAIGWSVEAVGPYQAAPDGRVVYVSGVERQTSAQGTSTAISVYHVVREGDVWMIEAHEVLG